MLKYLLLFEIASIANDLNIFMDPFSPQSLLHSPFLIHNFWSFVLFHQSFHLFNVEVGRRCNNAKEEMLINEYNSFFVFHNGIEICF